MSGKLGATWKWLKDPRGRAPLGIALAVVTYGAVWIAVYAGCAWAWRLAAAWLLGVPIGMLIHLLLKDFIRGDQ